MRSSRNRTAMIVKVLLPLILAFIMFTLGLGLRGADFKRVLQFPKAFFTGLGNQITLCIA